MKTTCHWDIPYSVPLGAPLISEVVEIGSGPVLYVYSTFSLDLGRNVIRVITEETIDRNGNLLYPEGSIGNKTSAKVIGRGSFYQPDWSVVGTVHDKKSGWIYHVLRKDLV